ncbi:MAG: Gfo/Idh/MocA family oxidoreductase [Caldilineaceae bacterium]
MQLNVTRLLTAPATEHNAQASHEWNSPKPDAPAPALAVIGCGYWGKNLVRNFLQLGALHTVCDATPAGRELAHSIAPAARILSDMADVFADPALSGVAIATPAETHHALVKRTAGR